MPPAYATWRGNRPQCSHSRLQRIRGPPAYSGPEANLLLQMPQRRSNSDELGCPRFERVYEVLRIGVRVETMLVGVAAGRGVKPPFGLAWNSGSMR